MVEAAGLRGQPVEVAGALEAPLVRDRPAPGRDQPVADARLVAPGQHARAVAAPMLRQPCLRGALAPAEVIAGAAPEPGHVADRALQLDEVEPALSIDRNNPL